jgi:hypothetical protein
MTSTCTATAQYLPVECGTGPASLCVNGICENCTTICYRATVPTAAYPCVQQAPSFLPVSVGKCVDTSPTGGQSYTDFTVTLGVPGNSFSYNFRIGSNYVNYPLPNYCVPFSYCREIINNVATGNIINIITLTSAISVPTPGGTLAAGSFDVGDIYTINIGANGGGGQITVTPFRQPCPTFSSSGGSSFSAISSSPPSNSSNSLMISNKVQPQVQNHTQIKPQNQIQGCQTCQNTAITMPPMIPTPVTMTSMAFNNCIPSMTGCNNVNVPIIFINGLLTPPPNYSDIAYVEFTISDEFTYYKEEPLPCEDRCVVAYIPANKVKETFLFRCCPFIVSVLKGKGRTAHEKALSIYNSMASSIGPSFFTFYLNLVLYSMSVYILSRILYGHFDINFVLRKHYDKFIKDLGNSRFCTFLQEFLDCDSVVFGYQRFFKYDLDHHHKPSKKIQKSLTDSSD